MSERDDPGDKSGRQPAEGVRIIKAEEAQAALEAGEAAGRRPDDQLRFGDVPPAPSGPRPAHRFPLPDSVDPAAAVELPPLAPDRPRRPEGQTFRPPPPPPEAPSGRGRTESRSASPFGIPVGDGYEDRAPRPDVAPDPRTAPAGFAPDDAPAAASDAAARPPDPAGGPPAPPAGPAAGARPAATGAGLAPADTGAAAAGAGDAGAGAGPTAASAEFAEPAGPVAGAVPASAWGPSDPDDRTTEMGVPPRADHEPAPPPAAPATPAPAMPYDVPEEGITVAGAPPEMPHWTEPPTGEVPRLRFDDEPDDGDDLDAWKALGSGQNARWRHEDDWDDADQLSDLMGEGEPVGALDQTRSEHSDLYSFDEDFARVTDRTGSNPVIELGHDEDDLDADMAPAGRAVGGRSRGAAGRRGSAAREARDGERIHRAPPRRGRRSVAAAADEDVRRPPAGARPALRRPSNRGGPTAAASRAGEHGGRVAVGVGLVVLLLIAYAIGPLGLLALATVVILAAAGEAYNMTRTAGFRPATLLGLVATVGSVLAAYWHGTEGIAVVTVLLFAGAIFWFVLGVEEARPLANVAVTVMVFVWVAVLGSFTSVMLRMSHGKGLFLGAAVVAVAADIAAFMVGRTIGNHPMAPAISPHKTIEGFLGGVVGAVIIGVIVGKTLTPWGGVKHGLVLGLVIGLVAPFGDLFESLIKRDLGVKDSGHLLGGHGGVLDRFDALLLALPAAWFVATLFHL